MEAQQGLVCSNLGDGLRVAKEVEDSVGNGLGSLEKGHCTSCAPILESLKPAFLSLLRQDSKLRH